MRKIIYTWNQDIIILKIVVGSLFDLLVIIIIFLLNVLELYILNNNDFNIYIYQKFIIILKVNK